MATSNTYDFGVTTETVDIVIEAFERCGIEPDSISGQMMESARRSIGFMFSSWSNDGPRLFDIYQLPVTLSAGTPSYALPVNTIYIVDAYTRQTLSGGVTQDLSMGAISRTEYWALPNKAQAAARPTQFYFQRTISPLIFPWPVLQAGGTCSLLLNIMRMSQDVGDLSNQLDAPQRAMDAIAADLAHRLSVKWAPDRSTVLKAQRDEAYGLFSAEDRERVPLRIGIDNPWGA